MVQRVARNERGRDFIVGDIHGVFSALRLLLESVNFDPAMDRLFSVGDLIDRGPESDEAIEWMLWPWFYACRGNHEQFVLESEDPEQLENWVNHNGGAWWLDLDDEQKKRVRDAVRQLPLAIEVETDSGLIGIVHADVPPRTTWDSFMERLEERVPDAVLFATWSRLRISGGAMGAGVTGRVERVYCGHTPTRRTVRLDNVWYVDTGAAYANAGYLDAQLTLVEVQPGPHHEHQIATAPLLGVSSDATNPG